MELHTFTAKRRAKGNHVRGHYSPGKLTTFEKLKGNIQPLNGQELLQVPEGDRQKENNWLFTSFEIADNDIVIYKDIKYEVQVVKDWTPFCISYYRARITKLDNQNEEI